MVVKLLYQLHELPHLKALISALATFAPFTEAPPF